MRFKDAIRVNSFAAYFNCENTENCCVIIRDGSEMAEMMEEYRFTIEELQGCRVLIIVAGKPYVLDDALRSLADAKGTKSWMALEDDVRSLI
jgi:hypothetical protein